MKSCHFILLIDDLRLQCLTHKYVDDTTLTELLPRGSSESQMQLHFQDLRDWTTYNKMKINYIKTKEMILVPLAKSPPDLLSHSSTTDVSVVIERVKSFKLLGINISHDFSWQTHVDVITSKAASRLHFLRILKKSGLNPQHLLHFYLSVICPVLEYCSVFWHHGLSKTQCESLEAIQCHALRIIFLVTVGMPYILALGYAQTSSLHSRHEEANKRFSGTCLTLSLVFSPYCLHPETALLLLESDLQQSTLVQLLEQNVLHLRSNTIC